MWGWAFGLWIAMTTQAEQGAKWPPSLEFLRSARAAWLAGDLLKAREAYQAVLAAEGVPPHHGEEAQEMLRLLEGGAGPFALPSPECRIVEEAKPAVRFYVAPNGSDAHPGTLERPFATLERARQAVRGLKAQQGLPKGGVAVLIRGGIYPVRGTLRLTEEDSGTPEAPVVYQAYPGERPIFTGGLRLERFEPVREANILRRLPQEARDKVVQADLKALGLEELPPLVLGGFASGRGFRTYPVMELYWNGSPLPLARWPNQGFVRIEGVSDENPILSHGRKGTATGPLFFPHERLSRWAEEPEVLLYGYWFWDWADSYERVERIDPTTGALYLEKPYSRYGFAPGQPFYALNLLCELDAPGEWYLDRQSGRLYLYPPGDVEEAVIELSVFPEPMVIMENVSHVRWEGITWELGAGDAIHVRGGRGCLFAGCTLRRFGGDALVLRDGLEHGVLSCDIHTLGRGAVVLASGDRKTLTPGRSFVENCHIHHLSRIDHTYTPAVLLSGVGNRVAHNLVHDIPSSAFRVGGNEHRIEYNEVFRVVLESDDQGGVDMFGDPTFRGNLFRFNFWHHIGGWEDPKRTPPLGRAGIRLDDAISGNIIYGNIFYRASSGRIGFGGVQIHGGKDNIVDNNLFLECRAAISFSPWPAQRWREFVAGRLEKPDIDRALYLARYPELARLEESPNANWIYRNVVVGCETFLHRDSQANAIGFNWLGPAEAAIEVLRPGHFRLRPDAPFWSAIGFRPIPIDRIGLYPDRFRSRLPEEVRDQGRAGLPTS